MIDLPRPLNSHLQLAGLMKEGAPPPKWSDKDIVEFIFFPVVNEGCRVIDEGEGRGQRAGRGRGRGGARARACACAFLLPRGLPRHSGG